MAKVSKAGYRRKLRKAATKIKSTRTKQEILKLKNTLTDAIGKENALVFFRLFHGPAEAVSFAEMFPNPLQAAQFAGLLTTFKEREHSRWDKLKQEAAVKNPEKITPHLLMKEKFSFHIMDHLSAFKPEQITKLVRGIGVKPAVELIIVAEHKEIKGLFEKKDAKLKQLKELFDAGHQESAIGLISFLSLYPVLKRRKWVISQWREGFSNIRIIDKITAELSRKPK